MFLNQAAVVPHIFSRRVAVRSLGEIGTVGAFLTIRGRRWRFGTTTLIPLDLATIRTCVCKTGATGTVPCLGFFFGNRWRFGTGTLIPFDRSTARCSVLNTTGDGADTLSAAIGGGIISTTGSFAGVGMMQSGTTLSELSAAQVLIDMLTDLVG